MSEPGQAPRGFVPTSKEPLPPLKRETSALPYIIFGGLIGYFLGARTKGFNGYKTGQQLVRAHAEIYQQDCAVLLCREKGTSYGFLKVERQSQSDFKGYVV